MKKKNCSFLFLFIITFLLSFEENSVFCQSIDSKTLNQICSDFIDNLTEYNKKQGHDEIKKIKEIAIINYPDTNYYYKNTNIDFDYINEINENIKTIFLQIKNKSFPDLKIIEVSSANIKISENFVENLFENINQYNISDTKAAQYFGQRVAANGILLIKPLPNPEMNSESIILSITLKSLYTFEIIYQENISVTRTIWRDEFDRGLNKLFNLSVGITDAIYLDVLDGIDCLSETSTELGKYLSNIVRTKISNLNGKQVQLINNSFTNPDKSVLKTGYFLNGDNINLTMILNTNNKLQKYSAFKIDISDYQIPKSIIDKNLPELRCIENYRWLNTALSLENSVFIKNLQDNFNKNKDSIAPYIDNNQILLITFRDSGFKFNSDVLKIKQTIITTLINSLNLRIGIDPELNPNYSSDNNQQRFNILEICLDNLDKYNNQLVFNYQFISPSNGNQFSSSIKIKTKKSLLKKWQFWTGIVGIIGGGKLWYDHNHKSEPVSPSNNDGTIIIGW